jgi:hypothetical protein
MKPCTTILVKTTIKVNQLKGLVQTDHNSQSDEFITAVKVSGVNTGVVGVDGSLSLGEPQTSPRVDVGRPKVT